MDKRAEMALPQPEVKTSEESVPLTPKQRELLRSLERSMMQAARGEGRPVQGLLRELRMKRAAEENANYRDA